jgi:hypothetical protein
MNYGKAVKEVWKRREDFEESSKIFPEKNSLLLFTKLYTSM